MERTARIATGESVAFEFELAGLGSRFIALLIDSAIQVGSLLAIGLLSLLLFWAIPHRAAIPASTIPLEKLGGGVLAALATFLTFVIFSGYFILFEWRMGGQTPGKRLLGIRVVRDGGFPLDVTAAVVRNVVRVIEAALGFYALSAACTLLSPFNRRLGDYAAGTIVVRDSRFERAPVPDYREERTSPVVADLSGVERDLVRSYAARRASLGKTARSDLAARIAYGIRPKLGASFAHLSDDELLEHLATTAL